MGLPALAMVIEVPAACSIDSAEHIATAANMINAPAIVEKAVLITLAFIVLILCPAAATMTDRSFPLFPFGPTFPI